MAVNKTAKKVTEEEKNAQEFVEATAQAIIDISAGISKLLNGKLKKRAIILLIQDAASVRISQDQIAKVLDAIASLDKTFLK